MTLSDQQFEFLKDTQKLLTYIINKGYKITYGETWRRRETQEWLVKEGLSKTMASLHIKRLAIDLNIFVPDGMINPAKYKAQKSGRGWWYLENHEDNLPLIDDIGAYWENLHDKNEAGMFWDFTDLFHFQRNLG
jgi:hypothetical protein